MTRLRRWLWYPGGWLCRYLPHRDENLPLGVLRWLDPYTEHRPTVMCARCGRFRVEGAPPERPRANPWPLLFALALVGQLGLWLLGASPLAGLTLALGVWVAWIWLMLQAVIERDGMRIVLGGAWSGWVGFWRWVFFTEYDQWRIGWVAATLITDFVVGIYLLIGAVGFVVMYTTQARDLARIEQTRQALRVTPPEAANQLAVAAAEANTTILSRQAANRNWLLDWMVPESFDRVPLIDLSTLNRR